MPFITVSRMYGSGGSEVAEIVARSLGWTRSAESPFAFTDASGQLVARTLFWVDGTNAEGGYGAELFGVGQALLISLPGKAKLESKCGRLSVGVRVEREIVDESGRTDKRLLIAPSP